VSVSIDIADPDAAEPIDVDDGMSVLAAAYVSLVILSNGGGRTFARDRPKDCGQSTKRMGNLADLAGEVPPPIQARVEPGPFATLQAHA